MDDPGDLMGHAEEIAFLDGIREAAIRRLEECAREAALTQDLESGDEKDEGISRRRKKLRTRADRYRELARRVEAGAADTRRLRLDAILSVGFPRLSVDALRLHRRARRLEAALAVAREKHRGIRMRHLALEREAAELSRILEETHPDRSEPPEIRADLGSFRTGEED